MMDAGCSFPAIEIDRWGPLADNNSGISTRIDTFIVELVPTVDVLNESVK